MAWKKRGNRLYYYRSVKRNGRVCTDYFGGGLVGRRAAEIDQKRQAQRLEYRELRRCWAAVKASVSEYGRQADVLLRNLFKAAGFYNSHGRWRRRMEAEKEITSDMSRADFDAIVKAANSGSAAALADLRETLRRNPDIWEAIGNLGEHAENALIGAISGDNVLLRESLKNTCESMMLELAGPTPGLIRKMAAQRVIMAWLEAQFADFSNPVPAGDLAHARFQLQRKQSAQTRFEKAVRTWKLVAGDNHSQFADNVLRVVG